jgi:hypothetical protein
MSESKQPIELPDPALVARLCEAVNAANAAFREWATANGVDCKGKEFFTLIENKELNSAVLEKYSNNFESEVLSTLLGAKGEWKQ